MTGRIVVAFMRLMAWLPLRAVRALGWSMGMVLYVLVVPRRRVVMRNLALCFPALPPRVRRAMARRNFVYFSQAWLDRGWLWHAPRAVLERRVVLRGAVRELEGDAPTIMFAPHFYGMDAAGTALTLHTMRPFTSIFKPQPDPALDAWLKAGRTRFGDVRMLNRDEGIKPIIAGLRKGGLLYLLPDMNFGAREALFVPFYGIPTATVPSLPRFARLGRAKVVPIVGRITPAGYEVRVMPAWDGYPSNDLEADTARMNAELQGYIDTMPDQYYWVHKRFKTRPSGEKSLY
ncbi:lipid A biosynthesis acyltransferase [Ramlibacter sp. H39-3-26]|uniref:LpxL/LpxP family acyltransferase n=1 Tax=Curvibacter soli TaxID=3031331 RepID=UPI0023DC3784|nr:lipid A biosynthesis acyltransferase [Ramlibacter sp. H39-3-26]MDF1483748.1 lipid A biosynthesis acyltransferase [Ramlibacter sp. H39-3-26]